ncbi:MAG: CDP-alcohol phosphatidyltransferase family protein [Alphaproteobacteria bacterium]|nr:CDP-alcohol phosphatidyltransferase family protein [Alphaproteobacteria bacterium]MBU0795526.1 CDP-alcohol phosphatidyltransferase family protein [Alphaproteobacteria bacterium]MBU0874671.1 CDP-alcohol phosphatidyltransferase family protein [Alphaproteobacteria bacterium]MBU1770079.1 CDP-alcohol phosphatidyltransferase family protein [Alphaproteobacteria bacterium]
MLHTHNRPAPPVNRIQNNLLAAPERRLLNWLCSILPRWVTPDMLTSLGVFGGLATFAGYAASSFGDHWLWLAMVGYVMQWFGDSLDGSLARYRRIERPSYGYFIDHSCDGIVTLLILGGMGFSPYVRVDVAMFAVVGYLLLSIHAYLAARVMGEFKLSYGMAGPTELRFLLIGMTIGMMLTDPAKAPSISGFDMIVGVVGVIFVVLFVSQTLVAGRQLSRSERDRR